MKPSPEQDREIAEFPPPLRALIEAELEAGNSIVEIGHSFPAAPCGAYLKLSRRVSTRPRQPAPDMDFYERNSGSHSGEFNDPRRHFFVLEPPLPPEPEPDMDRIRAAAAGPSTATPAAPSRSPASDRFIRSMDIDYERWRDGTGYDLAALSETTGEDRAALASDLVARGVRDWRDAEALAALDTDAARERLREAARDERAEIRLAVARFAPDVLNEAERTASLVRALETVTIFGGLTEALHEAELLHPPQVIESLLRGTLRRDGDVAVHFAALLWHLHGKSPEPFDLSERPLFLRFNTADAQERSRAFRELCGRIGVDPVPYLA